MTPSICCEFPHIFSMGSQDWNYSTTAVQFRYLDNQLLGPAKGEIRGFELHMRFFTLKKQTKHITYSNSIDGPFLDDLPIEM